MQFHSVVKQINSGSAPLAAKMSVLWANLKAKFHQIPVQVQVLSRNESLLSFDQLIEMIVSVKSSLKTS